ncbi:prepilin-type N-terminal cleavage/methylation domain-containing protein [bacterium]|nr:prepilin-type N-terminal cleavage/methylation domain-containing protein [bacterium]
MNKRLIPERPGYTLLEIMVVVIIMSILAAIGVPYMWEVVRQREAVRAKPQMIAIADAAIDFNQERNSWPDDLQELVEKGYLMLDQSLNQIWKFEWDQNNMTVIAVNVNPDKPNWYGRVVRYNMVTDRFAGFGVPAEREEFPRGPQ